MGFLLRMCLPGTIRRRRCGTFARLVVKMVVGGEFGSGEGGCGDGIGGENGKDGIGGGGKSGDFNPISNGLYVLAHHAQPMLFTHTKWHDYNI